MKNRLWFSRTPSGNLVFPVWLAFVIGGRYKGIGYNWYPGVVGITYKYFKEGWYKHRGYFDFISMGRFGIIDPTLREKYRV